jgi:hypothetical protein
VLQDRVQNGTISVETRNSGFEMVIVWYIYTEKANLNEALHSKSPSQLYSTPNATLSFKDSLYGMGFRRLTYENSQDGVERTLHARSTYTFHRHRHQIRLRHSTTTWQHATSSHGCFADQWSDAALAVPSLVSFTACTNSALASTTMSRI